MKKSTEKKYGHLTAKIAFLCAGPHTWIASVCPVLFATSLAIADKHHIDFIYMILILVSCIFMQSSVNTFNDHFDLLDGTDSLSDNVDVSDAPLLHYSISPKVSLTLGFVYLTCAFIIAIPIIVNFGAVPLIFGFTGALVVILYSGGKTPISYLPIGELVSGFVMGGLIPVSSYYVLAKDTLDWMVLAKALPVIICISLIMMTNNISDIEKDKDAGRKTLCIVLGRARSRILYRVLLIMILVTMGLILGLFYPKGLILFIFYAILSYSLYLPLFNMPLNQSSRIVAFSQISCITCITTSAYCMCILAGSYLI